MSLQEVFNPEVRVVSAKKEEQSQWTGEVVDMLKMLWADQRFLAKDIAIALNEKFGTTLTMGAVIGKVDRMRLPHRPRTARAAQNREMEKKIKRSKRGEVSRPDPRFIPAPPVAPNIYDAMIPVSQRKTLFELNGETCKYMIGDPGESSAFFCGGSVHKRSFCEHHYSRCFDGVPQRRDNRPTYRNGA